MTKQEDKQISYAELYDEIRDAIANKNDRSKYKEHIYWGKKDDGKEYLVVENLIVSTNPYYKDAIVNKCKNISFVDVSFYGEPEKKNALNRKVNKLSIELQDFDNVEFEGCYFYSSKKKDKIILKLSEYTSVIFKEVEALHTKLFVEYSDCKEKLNNKTFPSFRFEVHDSKFHILKIGCSLPSFINELNEYMQACFINILENTTMETFRHQVYFTDDRPKKEGDKCKYSIIPKNILKIIGGSSIRVLRIDGEYPDLQTLTRDVKIGLDVKDHPEIEKSNRKGNMNPNNKYKGGLDSKLYENKSVLQKFKKLADEKHDKVQEALLNKHLAYCDEQIIDIDTKPILFKWIKVNQDVLIMKAGSWLSNHGDSWLKPLLWAMYFGSVSSFIIYYLLCSYSGTNCSFSYQSFCYMTIGMAVYIACIYISCRLACNVCSSLKPLFWVILLGCPFIFSLYLFCSCSSESFSYPLIFLDVLNPVSSLSNIFKNMISNKYAESGIVVIVLLAKLISAICVYEFLRAARKFTIS